MTLATETEPTVPVRRVIGLFRPYRWLMLLLLSLVVAQSAAGVVGPFLLRGIIDHGLPERNGWLVTWLALGMIASALIAGILAVTSSRLANVIGQRVMHDLRVAVYDHLQGMSLGFFTRARGGDLLSRVINDIGGVDNVLTNTATATVQSAATAAAIAGAMLIMDWQLALLALLVVPAFLLVTFRLGRQLRKLARGRQRRLAKLTSLIQESLSVSGVLLARTMGLRGEFRRRFAEESQEISKLELAQAMAGRWRIASRRMALTIVPAVTYWLAGIEVANGASLASIGTVVAFTSMVNRLTGPAATVQGVGQQVSTSMALFARIFEALDLPVEEVDRPDAQPLRVTRGEVALRGVSFAYDEMGAAEPVLRDIDLVCRPGTMTAIVGATGSGKTTMAYLVARLYEPRSGKVMIDGTDLAGATRASIADSVGLVAQETYLLHASIRENLLLAKPSATQHELTAAARAAQVHDLIESLPDGYDTVVGDRGNRFSGGERQRLAIARVLLRNPPVLVLDEATSALDTRTERAVQEALDRLAEGRTTIVIAHRLATIERADQIVVLEHGRIVERGNHADLVALAGRYARFLRPDGDTGPTGPTGSPGARPMRVPPVGRDGVHSVVHRPSTESIG
jgi:ATP-binding cassette subfamily B protein